MSETEVWRSQEERACLMRTRKVDFRMDFCLGYAFPVRYKPWCTRDV